MTIEASSCSTFCKVRPIILAGGKAHGYSLAQEWAIIMASTQIASGCGAIEAKRCSCRFSYVEKRSMVKGPHLLLRKRKISGLRR